MKQKIRKFSNQKLEKEISECQREIELQAMWNNSRKKVAAKQYLQMLQEESSRRSQGQ